MEKHKSQFLNDEEGHDNNHNIDTHADDYISQHGKTCSMNIACL